MGGLNFRSMKIALVISSLGLGGAQRVLMAMAAYWQKKGWEVVIITLSTEGDDFFSVPVGTKRISLGLVGRSRNTISGLWSNIRRILAIRRAIALAKPAAVVSFLDTTNVLVLFATRGLGLPVLVSERIDTNAHRLPLIWRWLRHATYPWSSSVVVQTESARARLRTAVRATAVAVVPNMLAMSHHFIGGLQKRPEICRRLVLAVGRLSWQKGFDLLLVAFAMGRNAMDGWYLAICGDGDQRAKLEGLAVELGIANYVLFLGEVPKIEEWYVRADMFVSSSRYEGFPNALIEAMAFCLPVISFNYPSGPAEIVRDGTDGILVPPGNVAALSAAMVDLANNPEKRRELGRNAIAVRERYSIETVMQRWCALLVNAD